LVNKKYTNWHYLITTIKRFPHFIQVKKVHSFGGYGSQGYGYDWKIEEAKKNLLRTHTTAVSARMLYKLSQVKTKPLLIS